MSFHSSPSLAPRQRVARACATRPSEISRNTRPAVRAATLGPRPSNAPRFLDRRDDQITLDKLAQRTVPPGLDQHLANTQMLLNVGHGARRSGAPGCGSERLL